MKNIYIFFLFLIFLASVGLGQIALAQPEKPPINAIPGVGRSIPAGPQSGNDLYDIAIGLTNWLFVAFILAAVVFIMIAAYQFLSGGGDPQQVTQARQKFLWALVAIGLAVLSKGIPTVVTTILTTPSPVVP
jgi:hypothetical protein